MDVAAEAVSWNFSSHCSSAELSQIGRIDPSLACRVVDHDELMCREDLVWDTLTDYTRAMGERGERGGTPEALDQIYACCRYSLLSAPRLFTAVDSPYLVAASKDALLRGMAARVAAETNQPSALDNYLCTHPELHETARRFRRRTAPPPRLAVGRFRLISCTRLFSQVLFFG